ncbi:nuclear transport factor 2 family protein [Pontibacter sp. G13]|uniref:nuclear transport factor 2 family protein n=1 Tax=Pontibacter sp. G13 TaxID=3074898 RepID=UPI00288C3119|nr:nuclear transport factor 2 family protein [Pontibacter sp. G13]WNJ18514.1 nuclear transport factor 2 family protein [Pontibacter sp. G13]
MKSQVIFLALSLLFSVQSFATRSHKVDRATIREIRKTLNFYFEGVNFGDINAIAEAYHPHAYLTYVDVESGEYQKFQIGEYLTTLSQLPERKHCRDMLLESLDVTGEVALAKTVITWQHLPKRMTDYITIMKVDDEWRIISRVSYTEWASFETPHITRQDRKATQIEIYQTIRDYLSGGQTHDGEIFKKAFHPQADMAFVHPKHKTCQRLSMQDYLNLHARQSPNRKRQQIIESVDITGNIAVAKVKLRYKKINAMITDYICLVKTDGKWQITHKASHKEIKAMSIPI